jgi:flagellar hook-associated protein 2
MGTVGLNFGSPTSGAGFDVSTTVAEIVSNLQNVETPWKTQLTALHAQDTAISSLGTIFSNLSNSMSALTDLQGIMSQKEGSSSDQNVLTLTAANNTATAGTHTVQVISLAQTSSAHLAPIVNASDKLTGSITLQVGVNGASQTIALNSSNNTLAGLAAAINSSSVGVTANVLTDAKGSRLSLVSGTSGKNGNIVVGANSIVDTTALLNYTGTAGSGSTASTGALDGISIPGDTLSGSIAIQVGNGTTENVVIGAQPASNVPANTVYTGSASGDNTLSGLMGAINLAGLGVTASVVTNSDGASSLSLLSGTTGTAGTLTVTSKVLDTTQALGYSPSVTGADAQLIVDGDGSVANPLTSASNTVANMIPGVTFQLLAPSTKESDGSLEQVQVVIANDNAGVESAVSQFVSGYNSLVSAMNTQEGYDSSGNSEPLFGSPTLSLLQQQILGGLNQANPNGYLAAISNNTDTTLAGSVSIAVGSGPAQKFVMGSGVNQPGNNTFYTGSGSGANTLAGLASAINAAAADTNPTYSGTAGSSSVTSSGTLSATSISPLSGTMSIQVGSGAAEKVVIGAAPSSPAANTIYTGSATGYNTLSGVAAAINSATGIGFTANVTTAGGVDTLALTSGTTGTAGTLTVTPVIVASGTGVTATVVTNGTQSTLSLQSQTAGSTGALTVNSGIVATSDTLLSPSVTAGIDADSSTGASAVASAATLTSIANVGDTLTGSISIQVGSGAAQKINVPFFDSTLSGLASSITASHIGVSASVVTNSKGSYLSLTSATAGSNGSLTVTSSVLDATNSSNATLSYTSSSDLSALGNLGISVNNDGSIALDATSLDSLLNSDYSGVAGFFQGANGWGQNFSNTLTYSGTSAATGVLSLVSSSNSNIESTLNANISKEESLISAQQKSLTAELTSANEIMQELPSQLLGVNELYSAITGYNQNKG